MLGFRTHRCVFPSRRTLPVSSAQVLLALEELIKRRPFLPALPFCGEHSQQQRGPHGLPGQPQKEEG